MNAFVPSYVPVLIASYMRASATRKPGGRTGPFTLGLDAHTDEPMRNYAVPDSGASPSADDVAALIGAFRASQRAPRLEYVDDDAPEVWPALAAAGFTLERRTPVMIAVADTPLAPRSPAGITIRLAASPADISAALSVQHLAYEVPYPPGASDIDRAIRLTGRGGLLAAAIDEATGEVVGTGLVDVSAASGRTIVGEVAAVGVVAGFRRRGIASALSAYLARTAHAHGIGLVFLEAEPDEEQIYRRTGFTDATTKIWASLR
jgi:GNAT superfamily N-acetyltransferase